MDTMDTVPLKVLVSVDPKLLQQLLKGDIHVDIVTIDAQKARKTVHQVWGDDLVVCTGKFDGGGRVAVDWTALWWDDNGAVVTDLTLKWDSVVSRQGVVNRSAVRRSDRKKNERGSNEKHILIRK